MICTICGKTDDMLVENATGSGLRTVCLHHYIDRVPLTPVSIMEVKNHIVKIVKENDELRKDWAYIVTQKVERIESVIDQLRPLADVSSVFDFGEPEPKPATKDDFRDLRDSVDLLKKEINVNIKTISDSIRTEVIQSLDTNQAVMMSEISKINEKANTQYESISKLLNEIKQNNNTSRLQAIETTLTEIKTSTGDGLWSYLEEIDGGIKSKLNKILEITKVQEPIKEEVEPKVEPKKESAEKSTENPDDRRNTILESYITSKSIAEVSKTTGINLKAVSRYTEKLEKEGKLRAEGSNPRKYVKV